MITLNWIKETDKIIAQAKRAQLETHNGDLLVAKQQPSRVSKGGIHMPGIQGNLDSYFKGLARIIQIPVSGFASTSGTIPLPSEFRVGDFILFNHAARYKPNPEVMNFLFEYEVEETMEQRDVNDEYHDRGQLFFIPFPDIKMIKPLERVLESLNVSST